MVICVMVMQAKKIISQRIFKGMENGQIYCSMKKAMCGIQAQICI